MYRWNERLNFIKTDIVSNISYVCMFSFKQYNLFQFSRGS